MTRRYIVDVDGVPPSPSPISNAVVVGNQCWISGQLSVGEDGAYVPGSAIEEARRAFAHVFRIAEAAGKDKRLEALTDGGETDDVAFLLMGSLSRGPIAMPRGLSEG